MHQIFNYWLSYSPNLLRNPFSKIYSQSDTKLLNDIQISKLSPQIFSQRRLFDLGPLLQEREVYVSSGYTFRARLLGITLHPRIWTKHGKLGKPKELNRKRYYYVYIYISYLFQDKAPLPRSLREPTCCGTFINALLWWFQPNQLFMFKPLLLGEDFWIWPETRQG